MAIKNDEWIKQMALNNGMINPFSPRQIREGVISHGVSSYGYDMRIWNEFKIFAPQSAAVIDPKNIDSRNFADYKGNTCVIPPRGYVLGRTVEYFKIPRDVITVCFGKSSYARCGIIVNVTPFEPEWEGYATVCLINPTSSSVRVYANEGIAQILFIEAASVCEISYKDKKGKYQKQEEITLPKL